MRRQFRSKDNQHLRRRKRQQRRGAPKPLHYTECNPILPTTGEQHVKR